MCEAIVLYLAETTGFGQFDWFVLQLCSLLLFPLSHIATLVPGQPTRDRCFFYEATHKGSLAGREHGETNVKDSKVSNNSLNVSWVKNSGSFGNAPRLPEANCVCVCVHLCASVRATCNLVVRCSVSSPCQSKLVELQRAHPALPGPPRPLSPHRW